MGRAGATREGQAGPGTPPGRGAPAESPTERLMRSAQFFFPGTQSADRRSLYRGDARAAEDFYRERWRHDKEVRSTHGVNCTGSCSWKVYVKDGIITWETQQVDYPSPGPDLPEYEPRGCPRGASFSWYTYSPIRIRYPYVRSPLLSAWREVRAAHGDPVEAWGVLVADRERVTGWQRARGKGGFLRATWAEVSEMIAAAQVHTIKTYGPDRIVGFSPIPAMSMVSYAVGTRYLSLIGGTISSFYDWYADLPIASPQVLGDQTDVPESGDWWNLQLGGLDPALSLHARPGAEPVAVELPRFDVGARAGGECAAAACLPCASAACWSPPCSTWCARSTESPARDRGLGRRGRGAHRSRNPVFRRTGVAKVRATTSAVDYLALILLGIYLTLGVQEFGGGYNYRTTVAPWFRSLFTGNPDLAAITSAPIMYQVHATAAWMIFGVWPFSRLVHAWSFPLYYLWRPYIVYRRRSATRPSEPGTSGRRWRRIGSRY